MRIILYGINYYPECIGVGKYTCEMAEWLVKKGHQVRVVTAHPYYPQWRVDPKHNAFAYQYEIRNKVEIFRCPLWVPKRLNGFKRLIHLCSFALSSLPAMLKQMAWKPDVIIHIVPTLLCAVNAVFVARMIKSKVIVHMHDLEIDMAFGLHLLKNRWLKKMALMLETCLLKNYDLLTTISKPMQAMISKKVNHQKKKRDHL